MARTQQIVVAGGGAVGTTVALALAQTGRQVAVVDPAPLGANASGVAAGMLAPAFETLFDALSKDRFALFASARDLWSRFDVGLDASGALALGERDEVEAWAQRLEAVGARARVLAPDRTTAVTGGLAPPCWSVFSEEDWRLQPMAALARLRQNAAALGAKLVSGAVVGFEAGRAALAGGGFLPADLLVIATGAARGLAGRGPELGVLTPIKGHILRAASGFPPGPVVRARGRYLCPGPGEAVLGATMEAGVDDAAVDPEVAAQLAAGATALAPALAGLAWRAEAGVRGATPDGLPMVGASRAEGVLVAVGARRNGWLLAPMMAAETVRAVEGRAAGEFGRLFAPARFG
ncbi:MAG: FAD-dependent oxidoreductase [Caulobacteraceae bacterium]|nr:FAD-dependent oxidoreductase [Caulobacteraceae bacterium]